MRNTYLTNRFFILFGGIIGLFVFSFPVPFLFPLAQTTFVLAIVLVATDVLLLFNKSIAIKCRRRLPKVLSLGDESVVKIELHNQSKQKLKVQLIDELPFRFQKRDFDIRLELQVDEEKEVTYTIRPLERGEYTFGKVNMFIESMLGLVNRRLQHDYPMSIAVYPSIVQMKKYELRAFDRMSNLQGIKKIRKLGHSYEFEQIKNYVRGDDVRSVNWKASSRHAKLMVNQYEDERAQQVYCVIDKSRAMHMPFEGLSLMDYAINTTLVMSNIALQKHDRAGILTFSDKIGITIKAERKANQLNKILAALYKEQHRNNEANFELLFHSSRKLIKGRSLLLLFTNFESQYALDRVLPILRRINNLHLLVVVFFENTEIKEFVKTEVTRTEDIYLQTIAQKYLSEKEQMVQKLKQYGVQAVLTSPADLSVNTINKYLELKARGLI
ncbi:MAG: hypothetical protein ACI9VN_000288 [Patescibacteria group bacterium]